MGRELKRVALDFQWPLNKVWGGYINPHYAECPDCDGSGSTTAKHRLEDLVGLIMLSGEDAVDGRCHPYFNRMEGLYHTEGISPSKDMTDLTTGLAGRAPFGRMGHDACDRWSAVRKIVQAAGLPKDWGICTACSGEGIHKDHLDDYRSWTKSEPPAGDGYQIWETVSEGSPISPVFATPEELARWMVDHARSVDTGTSYEQWLLFINGPGWAPSFIGGSGGLKTGVQSL